MSVAADGAMQAFVEGGVLITDKNPSIVRDVLLSDLELWVAEHSSEWVFVHAGCVALDGLAIVIPGRSMTGKTSLVAALIAAGATYFSDEYAVMDKTGFVWPYPRPLHIRPSGTGELAMRVPPGLLGCVVGGAPARVGLVASVRHDAASGWNIREMAQGEAALSLIDNSVAARQHPEAVLTSVIAATEGATALSGTRGDASDAAHKLLGHLAACRSARPSGAKLPVVASAP